MHKEFNKIIDDKNILILGFGREGKSTYKLLRRYFPNKRLTISDLNEDLLIENNFLSKDDKLELFLGSDYLKSINSFDLIIKSPGISFKDVNIIDETIISSQTDIFLRIYGEQVIGVTGTKGKSTTSSLLFHIISANKTDTVLIGNIGLPPFEIIDKITNNTIIIFELSSHQLQYISKAPGISVLLNIYQEHLDHYNSFWDYQLSKFNIALKQNMNNSFVFNCDDELINLLLDKYKIKSKKLACSVIAETDCFIYENKIQFRSNEKTEEIFDLNKPINLMGEHNVKNIMAAVVCCKIIGVPTELLQEKISDFKGLEHRLEFVETSGSIRFYNDSIATIPEATIEAIKTLEVVDTLILGGYDRGIDYTNLLDFIAKSEIRNIILFGKVGENLHAELQKITNLKSSLFLIKQLGEISMIIKNNTKPGSICLLSPAASSYDMFKNFEHRGDIFKEIVKDL
ncbi:UDP-N-acetylmuramoyl-L-alanine--D-glutamate ligase [Bacteroidota bacterium]